ncbi:hypothetical protein FHS82_000732 [Pseudochelatococcus lubricantis]|uniref:DUF308 domain-containing protein n=1 Tax=Pseudochelatococcus lubricantis TaxID=1538102 RepID=A0ABX0UYG8_9HYPH|nr:hypothetical protein [Pseudochelatococcus lubricantis]NIJ56919.1 hypothetical protein [Pseudochelatococcus lubricantis]
MIFISTVLACLLIGGGLGAVVIGSGMIVLERGWSMVISGSVVATGGVLLLGIAMILKELRRLPDRLADALPEAPAPHSYYHDADFDGAPAAPDHAASVRPRFEPLVAHAPEAAEEHEPEPPAPAPATRVTAAQAAPTQAATPLGAPSLGAPSLGAPSLGAAPDFLTLRDVPLHDEDAWRRDAAAAPVAAGESRQDRSALKIQVSLHGEDTEAPESERQRRGFWSRFGKGSSTAAQGRNAPPEPPPGPTAAELARERLALADVPDRSRPDSRRPAAPSAPQDEAHEPAVAPSRSTPDLPKADQPAGGDGEPAGPTPPGEPAKEAAGDDRQPRQPEAPDGRKPDAAAKAAEQPAERAETRDEESGTEEEAGSPTADAPDAPPAANETADRPEGNTGAIVGSYRAGDNVYVMFDNGMIEAETPQGVFRFDSLDNLKSYIASGEDPALAGKKIDRQPDGGKPD